MKRLIVIAIVVALVATFINDLGRYAKTRYDLSNTAMTTADALVDEPSASRDTNARAAARLAQAEGATVYLYDQDDTKIYVWVQKPVEGTWALAPIMALISGSPIDTPYFVQAEDTAFFR